MNDFQSKFFRYWCWFVDNNQHELYDVLMSMIKDRIEQLMPQLIEQYFKEYVNTISVDVRTKLNGKTVDLSGLKNDITQLIIEGLKNK